MKKIMFITHQLTRTGAPMVMMEAVHACVDAGFDVRMISMHDGDLREDVEALNIPLSIRSEFMDDWKSFLMDVWECDLVFVNTIVPLQAIHILNLAPPQVIWWLHEPEVYFEVYEKWLPNLHELKPHIHIWAVSPTVAATLKNRYNYDAEIVPFGIRDVADRSQSCHEKMEIVTFLTIGIFCKGKGQDIAKDAISKLPTDLSEKCRFLFCGNCTDVEPDIYKPLIQFSKENPQVKIMDSLPHNAILEQIASTDYMLIPSREDSMPTVAAEAMMLSVPSIISDACGITRYLEADEECLMFPSGDVDALTQSITKAVRLRTQEAEQYEKMRMRARECYERNFSVASLCEVLLRVLDEDKK